MRFQKILNPAFAESFIKIGQKLKNRQPNVLIGLFMHFPFRNMQEKLEKGFIHSDVGPFSLQFIDSNFGGQNHRQHV